MYYVWYRETVEWYRCERQWNGYRHIGEARAAAERLFNSANGPREVQVRDDANRVVYVTAAL